MEGHDNNNTCAQLQQNAVIITQWTVNTNIVLPVALLQVMVRLDTTTKRRRQIPLGLQGRGGEGGGERRRGGGGGEERGGVDQ